MHTAALLERYDNLTARLLPAIEKVWKNIWENMEKLEKTCFFGVYLIPP